jgi:hypothetical protein
MTTPIVKPQLLYYFNKQNNFIYTLEQLFGGQCIQIDMAYNDNSTSVIALANVKNNQALTPNYYTFNKMFIAGRKTNETDRMSYELMLQGSINDYTRNSLKQILLILPIHESSYSTIKADSPFTSLNNKYLKAIFDNINLTGAPNILSTESDGITHIDLNNFIGNLDSSNLSSNSTLSTNINDDKSKISYNIIRFKKSYLWLDTTNIPALIAISQYALPEIKDDNNVVINVINNNMPITPSTETDIYIDCSPTDSKGKSVAVYTSKNLDQLNLFQINDLKIWAFRFITLFVLLLIIFVVIKFFQIGGKKVDQHVAAPSQPAPSQPIP